MHSILSYIDSLWLFLVDQNKFPSRLLLIDLLARFDMSVAVRQLRQNTPSIIDHAVLVMIDRMIIYYVNIQ